MPWQQTNLLKYIWIFCVNAFVNQYHDGLLRWMFYPPATLSMSVELKVKANDIYIYIIVSARAIIFFCTLATILIFNPFVFCNIEARTIMINFKLKSLALIFPAHGKFNYFSKKLFQIFSHRYNMQTRRVETSKSLKKKKTICSCKA